MVHVQVYRNQSYPAHVDTFIVWNFLFLQDHTPNPADCILLVKEWTVSDHLSQAPMVCLPHDYVQRLTAETLMPHPNNVLGERAVKEPLVRLGFARCGSSSGCS